MCTKGPCSSNENILHSPCGEVVIFARRLVHSPEAVQGRDAVEEVCAPPPSEPSRFELFAGDDGIRYLLVALHTRVVLGNKRSTCSWLHIHEWCWKQEDY